MECQIRTAVFGCTDHPASTASYQVLDIERTTEFDVMAKAIGLYLSQYYMTCREVGRDMSAFDFAAFIVVREAEETSVEGD